MWMNISSPRIEWFIIRHYIHSKYDGLDGFTVVDDGLSDLEEFFLMSSCKHVIMANSTFSWWAAWLNENPDAIQIAPDPWLNPEHCGTRDYSDIYTSRMIRLSGR